MLSRDAGRDFIDSSSETDGCLWVVRGGRLGLVDLSLSVECFDVEVRGSVFDITLSGGTVFFISTVFEGLSRLLAGLLRTGLLAG